MTTRSELVEWLLHNGFSAKPRGPSGHVQYEHDGSGVKITVRAHGRREMSRKQVGMVVRQLETAGFDREVVRRALS